MFDRFLAAAAVFALMPCALGADALGTWSLKSPNGGVEAGISLASGRLSYNMKLNTSGGSKDVLGESPLGVLLESDDLSQGLRLISATSPREIIESYTLLHGKKLACTNTGREITLSLMNGRGAMLEVDFRAYNDGVAFRYRLPGVGTGTLRAERSGFAIAQSGRFWAAPADKATTYSPGYETYYENGAAIGKASPLGLGWSFPFLYQTAQGAWALITESAVNGTFCGTRLANAPTNGIYRVELPSSDEGNGTGEIHPTAQLPWVMPWRVVIAGETLATIVESTLVTDVHPPVQMTNSAWIRPGRVAWSWWSDNPSPRDAEKQKKFVDLAAEMSWEYVLVDANWTIMDKGNTREVIDYATAKGVGVLLWYNSGGPHNIVTEKPRDSLTYEPVRKFELAMLKEWGVKGIKVDFFQSDKQNVMALYHGIMKDAAEHQIMVNFHGCTLPRGWERQYPHLMSMEAVRGAECYIFDSKYPDAAPVQNAILPFTRNVVGPMDYTPVALSDNKYPHKTTSAHELALAVLFESGWLHFADRVEAYTSLAELPKRYLKTVPVAWDETKFVQGEPGNYVVLARRKGAVWYIAGVNGRADKRELSLALGTLLGGSSYSCTMIRDGAQAREIQAGVEKWSAGEPMRVAMLPFGGFLAELRK